jgi:hypothetical protein
MLLLVPEDAMPATRLLPAAHNPRSPFSLVVTVVGLAGVAAFFLPFVSDVSPLAVVAAMFSDDSYLNQLWRFGLPLLLAMLVTAATIRWDISSRFTRAERLAAYLAALLAACCALSSSFLYLVEDAPSTFLEWFMMAFLWVGSAAGGYLLWRNSRTGVPSTSNAIAAMQVVYLVVAVYCLVGFRSLGWEVGAYLVAITTLVYLTQIVAISVAAPGQVTQVNHSMTTP